MELIFVIFTGITSLILILLLFSLFGSAPGEDARHRMEQYFVETEMAAAEYIDPDASGDEGEEGKSADEVDDDDWVREQRGEAGSGIKRLLANVGSILTPQKVALRIAADLAKADLPLKANEFVAMRFLAVTILSSLGMIITSNILMGIVFGLAGFFLPGIYVSILKKKRIAAFNEQILDSLVMISNGLKAGYSFLQAMEMVSRETLPPMGTELKRVLKENSLGVNLEETLIALNERVESEDWDLVTTVVLIQRQVGGNLAEILEKIGYTIRQRMKIKGDIQTKTAQAKVSGLMVGVLPLGIGFMVYLINPAFMSKLFTFKRGIFRGWYVVVAGLIWEVIGMYIIMKIVDIEV